MKWTGEQDDRLRKLRADGVPFTEIGTTLDVTRNAAIGRAGRLGLLTKRGAPKPRNRSPNRPKVEPRISKQRLAMKRKDKLACPAPAGTKSLLDLAPGDCRWPFGERPYTFCGARAVAGSSYCARHMGIAYRRGAVSAPERAQARMSRFGHWATGTAE
jgi:GcrA cell cycle regulator